MSYPGYEKGPEPPASAQPRPDSNKLPYGAPPLLVSQPSNGEALGTPPNPQGYYPPYSGDPNQDPITYPPEQVLLVSSHPTNAPDYLRYSIFTLLCCCLHLGIVALLFSFRTRDANDAGNTAQAWQNSRLARNYGHAALGLGILVTIACIAIVVTYSVWIYRNHH